LKKCQGCGSINSDDDSICGVCGRSLSEVVSGDLAELAVARGPGSTSSRLSRRRVFAIVSAAALALIGAGLYILLFVALFGAVILLSGIMFLIFLLDIPNVMIGKKLGSGRREVLREEEEERERETGEED
jgi:hypothetical protein